MADHHQQGGHEEGDEGWIVSYADLVTLMLGFFILMYKVVADEGSVKKLEKRIGESLLGHKRPTMEQVLEDASEERKARAFQLLVAMLDLGDNALGTVERQYSAAQDKQSLKKSLEEKLDPAAQKNLQLLRSDSEDEPYLALQLPTDTNFVSGEAKLLEQAQQHLRELAKELGKLDDLLQVEVIGHSDDTAVRSGGRWESNWDIAAARAASVAKVLREAGLSGEQLKVSGVAQFHPLIPLAGLSGTALEEARRKNRRIELILKRKFPEPQTKE